MTFTVIGFCSRTRKVGFCQATSTPAVGWRCTDVVPGRGVLTVQAHGDLDALAEVLGRRVPGASSARRVDGTVVLEVSGGGGVLPTVISMADEAGHTITDLSIAEPTLETVFINLTGKDLRD